MQQSGSLAPGNPPEALNITDSEAVVKMHRSYLEAGSDVISTNTFGAHRLKFENYREIIEKGIECAKKAMCGFENRYIAFSIGPTGRMLKPLGDLDFEDAVQSFSDSIKIAERCGADLIICETLTDSYETKAALLAAKESCPLPQIKAEAFVPAVKLAAKLMRTNQNIAQAPVTACKNAFKHTDVALMVTVLYVPVSYLIF